MPEAPEVLDYFLFLKYRLINRQLLSLSFMSGKYKRQAPNGYEYLLQHLPLTITHVYVKGKTIFVVLKEGTFSLVFTHGMTGCWTDELDVPHARLRLDCADSQPVFFVDPRNFGRVTILTTTRDLKREVLRLGPYVLSKTFTVDEFMSRLRAHPKKKIGIVLMDQTVISGIGNYLRCDILWYSRLKSDVEVRDLTTSQFHTLYNACVNMTRFYAGLKNTLTITPQMFGRHTFVYMQPTDPYGKQVIQRNLASRTVHEVGSFLHYPSLC